jgi:predicted permease
MSFLLGALLVSFILSISSSWAIQRYKGKYGRREKLATGVIGVSMFVFALTMFFGGSVFMSESGERIVLAVYIALVLIPVVIVYLLLRGESS